MGVRSSLESKFLNHICACQVVTAPPINDDANRPLLYDAFSVEQILSLVLFLWSDLRIEDTLYNKAQILVSSISSNMFFILS